MRTEQNQKIHEHIKRLHFHNVKLQKPRQRRARHTCINQQINRGDNEMRTEQNQKIHRHIKSLHFQTAKWQKPRQRRARHTCINQ